MYIYCSLKLHKALYIYIHTPAKAFHSTFPGSVILSKTPASSARPKTPPRRARHLKTPARSARPTTPPVRAMPSNAPAAQKRVLDEEPEPGIEPFNVWSTIALDSQRQFKVHVSPAGATRQEQAELQFMVKNAEQALGFHYIYIGKTLVGETYSKYIYICFCFGASCAAPSPGP